MRRVHHPVGASRPDRLRTSEPALARNRETLRARAESIHARNPEVCARTRLLNGIMEAVAALDVDVLLIENARSNEALLEVIRERDYARGGSLSAISSLTREGV